MAAANNNGKWPASPAILTSLCQQTVETQKAFLAYSTSAGTPAATFQRAFYCPSNPAQDPATLWSSTGLSTWGYVWLNDRGTSGTALPATFPPHTPPLQYLSTPNVKNPSTTILALDVIVTDTDHPPLNYTPKPAPLPFATNHIPTGTAASTNSANVLYADGHVESVKFSPATATPVPQPAGSFLWFPNPAP